MGNTTEQTEARGRSAPAALRPPAAMWLRTVVGLMVIAVLSVLLWVDSHWQHGYVYAVVAAAIVAVAMQEYCRLAQAAGVAVARRFLVFAAVVFFLLQWAGMAFEFLDGPLVLGSAFLCVAALALLSGAVLRQRVGGAIERVGVSLGGLVYVPVLFGFLTVVRFRWGVGGVVTTIAVCKGCDVGAYYAGKIWGRRRLAPILSPHKTVAGAIGGIVGSTLVALVLSLVLPRPVLVLWLSVVYGVAAAVAAILGDLAESLMKRQAAVKDSGNLLPGHGGMLDIVDDVLFVAPLSCFFFSYFAGV